jgi:hypothetical protein
MGGHARAFFEGLIRPSPASFFGAIVVAVLEIVGATLLLTPRNIAKLDPRVLMRTESDDYAQATVIAFKLRGHPKETLGVVYLGASVAERAIFDGYAPGPIEADLESEVGQPVRFYSLFAHGQLVSEALTLAEQMPPGFRGVVTLMLHDGHDDVRQRRARASQHMPAQLLALDDPGAPKGKSKERTGVFFLDHFTFFASRRDNLLWPRIAIRGQRRGGLLYHSPPAPGTEAFAFERYAENPMPIVRQALPALNQFLAEMTRRGVTAVLVEAPENPDYLALKVDDHEAYLNAMKAMTARHGAEFWDLNPEVQVVREDFADAVHLGNDVARMRFQKIFVDHLARALRDVAAAPPKP